MLRSVKLFISFGFFISSFALWAQDNAKEASFSHSQLLQTDQINTFRAPTATLEVDKGDLLQNLEISVSSITESNLPKLDRGMTNVTDSFSGYRFLPHGEHFTGKGAKVVLGYDRTKIPNGYTEDDIRTYYYDEQEGRWIPLQRDSIDKKNRLIISRTTHFTDMINGVIQAPESPETQGFTPTMMSDLQAADPTSKVQLISAPQANNTGAASLSYNLEMPPARNGMAPKLSVSYSSDASSGWLGEGWNLTTPTISVDTRWGVPRYDEKTETETYSIDGQMLVREGMKEPAHRELGVNRKSGRVKFYPRKESGFALIERIGSNPSNYIWEVTDRTGTKYTYGEYIINESKDENGETVYDTTVVGVMKGRYQNSDRVVISEWKLTRVEEIHGDYVEYKYAYNVNTSNGLSHYSLYLDSVKAGNHEEQPHTIVKLVNGKEKLIKKVEGRYGYFTSSNNLLDSVNVYFEGKYLRGYKFTYTEGSFSTDLLSSISHLDSDRKEFNQHKMQYNQLKGDLYEKEAVSYTAKNDKEDFSFFDKLKEGFDSKLSMINGGSSVDGFSAGGGCNLGVAVAFGGLSYTFGHNTSNGNITLTDINGDGLPDKVFVERDELYYQPAIYGSQDFGEKIKVRGKNVPSGFAKSVSNSHTLSEEVGAGYSAVSASLTFSQTWENSKTKTYFQDMNSDGLIDIVDNGAVYFNHLDEEGVPTFSLYSSDTPNELGAMSMSMIPTFGSFNNTITDEDRQHIKDSLLSIFPQHDIVRVWKAPFDGTISVQGTAIYEPNQANEEFDSKFVDGVTCYLQIHDGKGEGQFYEYGLNMSNKKAETGYEGPIKAGQYVFFRVSSGEQGVADNVSWDPSITYTKFDNSNTPEKDELGISFKQYKASEDYVRGIDETVAVNGGSTFQLNNEEGHGFRKLAATLGDIRLNVSYFYESNPENVQTYTETIKADEIIDEERFIQMNQDNLISVPDEDKLSVSFSIDSDLPYDDKVVIWRPSVSVIGKEIVDGKENQQKYVKTPSRMMYNKIVNIGQSSGVLFVDYLDSEEDTEDQFTVKIKTNGFGDLQSKSFVYDNDNKSILIDENGDYFRFKEEQLYNVKDWKGKNISLLTYVDGYSDDAKSKMIEIYLEKKQLEPSSEETSEETESEEKAEEEEEPLPVHVINSMIKTYVSGDEQRMGFLYKGWGQFAYRGDDMDLKNKKYTLKKLIDLSDLSTFSSMENKEDLENLKDEVDDDDLSDDEKAKKLRENKDLVNSAIGGEDMTKVNFYSLSYNSQEDVYYGSTSYVYLSSTSQVSSRLGNPTIDVEAELPVYNLAEPTEGHSGAAMAPILESKSFSLGETLGGGASIGSFGAGANGSFSQTTSESETYLLDLNGDGYPDWIYGDEKNLSAKYTTTQGVLSNQEYKNKDPFGTSTQSSNAKSFGLSGKGGTASDHKNPGYNGKLTIEQLKAIAKERANSEASLSASASGDISSGSSSSEKELIDINGDGLPDMVTTSGVFLNCGYSFVPVSDLNFGDINASKCNSVAAGASVCVPLCGSANIGAGANATFSNNTTTMQLMDINADGLVDMVEENDEKLYVYINKGLNGFSSAIEVNIPNLSKSKSTSVSIHANGGCTIPAWIFTVTPFASGSKSFSVSRTLNSMSDFDCDGFPDFVSSDDESKVEVRYSRVGSTNKLQSVTNPFGGSFTIDYAHTQPTADHPGGKWAMSGLTLNDATDFNPNMHVTFEYSDGKRDRRERDFLGFGKVITHAHGNDDAIVRTTIEEFDVENYLTAGSPTRTLIVGGKEDGNNKYREEITKYEHFAVKNGSTIQSTTDLMNTTSLYSAPVEKTTIVYDKESNEGSGNNMEKISLPLSKETYQYTDEYANISVYNFTDLTSNTGYTTTIQYANNKYGTPKDVQVKGSDDVLYRHTSATYADKKNPTSMTSMKQYLNEEKTATCNFRYDQYGNLVHRSFPAVNESGKEDSTYFDYTYDRKYNMYPERVSDVFGYHYDMEDYDYRYGIPCTVRDMNGYTVQYHIDNLGRVDTIIAPNEQTDGVPYTISYQYNDKGDYNTRYAITNHYDPQHPEDPLLTITHVDGLGRPLQVKKDAEITDEDGNSSTKMIVSGRIKTNALGDIVATYHPTTCDTKDYASIVEFSDKIMNKTQYDEFSRPISQTLPSDESGSNKESVTTMSYSIVEVNIGDKSQKVIKTESVSPNGNVQDSYANGFGQTILSERKLEGNVVPINYYYDPIGQLLSVIDAGNNKTTYTYDMGGRKLSIEHPSMGLTTLEYDIAGNVIKKQTASLLKDNQIEKEEDRVIQYKYEKNRLSEIVYPKHPQNNVKYTYGSVNAKHNRVGRVALIEDGSGAQEFFYGRMGELTKQRRTLVIPNQAVATYTTEWKYDSHNRLMEMTYPDGEVISYHYNLGGLLSSVTGKKDYTYDYISKIGYDAYEQKSYVKYGNGTETKYTYSSERRRLSNLQVNSPKYAGEPIMNNSYTYDEMDNITKFFNKVNSKSKKDNSDKKMAGAILHTYQYDEWNRLIGAQGSYWDEFEAVDETNQSMDAAKATYDLQMEYDELYNVTHKKLDVRQTGMQIKGTIKAGHELTYNYDENDRFRLLNVQADEYRVADDESVEVTEDDHVKTQADYTYDANGNLSEVKDEMKKDSLLWDEDNHLLAINKNGRVNSYFYDASGERTVKYTTDYEDIFVNGVCQNKNELSGKFVAYVSPYFVVKNGGEYTKHIYAGDQRIASKIGDFEGFGADPRRVAVAGADVPNSEIDFGSKYSRLNEQLKMCYDTFDIECTLQENKNYQDNESFCCSTGQVQQMPSTSTQESTGEEVAAEDLIFFYHPDHLGSTSMVTDAEGYITQNVSYIPYGEVFVEERNGVWNTPYLFNAKELDEETGMYYYGARYLNPKDTRWLSVDPLFEKYVGMSPYGYCAGNPVRLVDVDGRAVYQSEDGSQSYMVVDEKRAAEYGVRFKHKDNGITYKKVSDGYDINDVEKNVDKDNATKRNEQTSGMMIFGMNDQEDKSVDDRAKHQDKPVDSSDMNLAWNVNFSIKKWFKSLFSSSQEENSDNPVEIQEKQETKPSEKVVTTVRTVGHIINEKYSQRHGDVFFPAYDTVIEITQRNAATKETIKDTVIHPYKP